ncbi:MAG: condensation domain-containing protein [Caulobacteraceae bacterium]
MQNNDKLDRQIVEDIYELTPMQESMLCQYVLNPEDEQFFEQACYKIQGKFDIELFSRAWGVVFQTNEMLRTVFRWQGLQKPIQIVLKKHDVPIDMYDLSNKTNKQSFDIYSNLKKKIRKEKVDLIRCPLNISLFKFSNNNYEMVISNHHIIMDGWSNVVMLKEFLEAYISLYNGRDANIVLKTKYKEFIKWRNNRPKTEDEIYWRSFFKKNNSETIYAARYKSYKNANAESYFEYVLNGNLKKKMMDLGKRLQITTAAIFYSVWAILLYKHYNIRNVVFGITVSGRTKDIIGIEKIVGLFINTVPFRIEVHPEKNVFDILDTTGKNLIELSEYCHTPLTDIITYSGNSYNSVIFDTIVVIQNYSLDKLLYEKNDILNISLVSRSYKTNMNLVLGIRTFDNIILDFTYNPNLFGTAEIERLAKDYAAILDSVINSYIQGNTFYKVQEINLTAEEKQETVYWIRKNREYLNKFYEVNFDEIL